MTSTQPDPALAAAFMPMNTGIGMASALGVTEPHDHVRRKDLRRAEATALVREDESTLLLVTELPGSVCLQRRGDDGSWGTLTTQPASRTGRTRVELPPAGTTRAVFRVVFSPKDPDLAAWTSKDVRS